MEIVEFFTARQAFKFESNPVMSSRSFYRYQVPGEFAGPDIEALERVRNTEGNEYLRCPLTEDLGGIVAREDDVAPKLRDYLNEHGCIVAERRIITQFDCYVVFRVFNHYNDNPNAPLFRLWRAADLKELSISQYASVEFVDWLKENFDTSGLRFDYIYREEPYESLYEG